MFLNLNITSFLCFLKEDWAHEIRQEPSQYKNKAVIIFENFWDFHYDWQHVAIIDEKYNFILIKWGLQDVLSVCKRLHDKKKCVKFSQACYYISSFPQQAINLDLWHSQVDIEGYLFYLSLFCWLLKYSRTFFSPSYKLMLSASWLYTI